MRNNLQRKACICHMPTVHETVFKILVLMPQLNTMHTIFLKNGDRTSGSPCTTVIRISKI